MSRSDSPYRTGTPYVSLPTFPYAYPPPAPSGWPPMIPTTFPPAYGSAPYAYGYPPPPPGWDPYTSWHPMAPTMNPAWGGKSDVAERPSMPMISGPPPRIAKPLVPHPKTPNGLPPSSDDLQLQLKEVEALMDVYATLRGFSFTLRLSPFTLLELAREIGTQRTSPLVDEVAVQLLRTLQASPPMVSEELEGVTLYKDEIDGHYVVREKVLSMLKEDVWRFLDNISWPEFVRKFCHMPVPAKIAVLRTLCEDVLDSPIVKNQINLREEQFVLCIENEGYEVAERHSVQKKVADGRRKEAVGGEEEEASVVLPQHDHLYVRDGLSDLELDECDVTSLGGTLICCDGCPASYLSKSVGLKRVGDENQKWFCEECRIGGQIRSYRFVHRASPAMMWHAIPLVAHVGWGRQEIDVQYAHGRVLVGGRDGLIAYYSKAEQVDALISWLKGEAATDPAEGAAPDKGEARAEIRQYDEGMDVDGRPDGEGQGECAGEDGEKEDADEGEQRSKRAKREPKSHEEEDEDRGAGETPAEKRSRRAFKALPQEDGGAASEEEEEEEKEEEEEEKEEEEEEEKPVKRRPGRPKKQSESSGSGKSPLKEKITEEKGKKKRGRPKKQSADAEEGGDEEGESQQEEKSKSKRGRPKKQADPDEEEQEAQDDAEDGGEEEKDKKKRGRRKKQLEPEEEDWNAEEEEDWEEDKVESKKKRRSKGRKSYAEEDTGELVEDVGGEDWDALTVLKRKREVLGEEMKFRAIVESKQMRSRDYVNKYRDAISAQDVRLIYKNKGKDAKDGGLVYGSRKWSGWPRYNDTNVDTGTGLRFVATYLFRVEKEIQGLALGPWLTRKGKREWVDTVKNTKEVQDVAEAALTFEEALRPIAFSPSWLSSDSKEAKKKRRSGCGDWPKLMVGWTEHDARGNRRGRPKKKDQPAQQDIDFAELIKAGVYEGVEGMELPEEDSSDDEVVKYCWVGGQRATPTDLKLSQKSLREVVLSGGEVELNNMVYRGEHVVPSARLRWIREVMEARTVAGLAIQLRVLEEVIRWDALKRPEAPRKATTAMTHYPNGDPVEEKAVGKRESERHGLQYLIKFVSEEENPTWTPEDMAPLWLMNNYEIEARKEQKAYWWRDFDFHPGACLEVEYDGQWYQAYVVRAIMQLDEQSRGEFDLKEWKDGVGMVLVHYIGGREDEDEWVPRDSLRLREDKMAERHIMMERLRLQEEQRRAALIRDKEMRMMARMQMFEERKQLREQATKRRQDRDLEKKLDKERRQQAKADRMREKEQEKEARKTQREQDRELKIKQRREEQERRKEQKKQERVCAREQQRILQSKSSWWKEFDWVVGVMVEMEYEGEWWDAIVIKLVDVPDRKQIEDKKPASQNPGAHSAAVNAAVAGSETAATRDADVEKHSSGDGNAGTNDVAKDDQVDHKPSEPGGEIGATSSKMEVEYTVEGGDAAEANATDQENGCPAGEGPGASADVEMEDKSAGEQRTKDEPPSGANDEEAPEGSEQADDTEAAPPPPPPLEGGGDDAQKAAVSQDTGEEFKVSEGDTGQAAATSVEAGEGASGSRDQVDNSALLPYIQLAMCQGPAIRYPDDWPEDGVYICAEDDRPLDVARLHRVNLTRLVAQNKKTYPGLTKTSPLKAGTALKLPLPLDIAIEDEPAPPPDPLKVGVVLIHYVGGSEEETEWVYTCSKRMRPSADKTWNAVAVEAADEMQAVLAPDPGAWLKHCTKVLKRVKKNDKSWPFWEAVDLEEMPDYHDYVSKPMWLDKIESNLLETYSGPQEFEEDMRLLFQNAMKVNPQDHTYHRYASKLLSLFEELWAQGHEGNNWGQAYGQAHPSLVKDPPKSVQSSSKKKSTPRPLDAKTTKQPQDKPAGSKSSSELKLTAASRDILREMLETLMEAECGQPFCEPVTPDIAPDYLDVIKFPMDLGAIKTNLEKGRYLVAKSFVRDVKLVVENAMTYNPEGDEIRGLAEELDKAFDTAWADVIPALEEALEDKGSRAQRAKKAKDEDEQTESDRRKSGAGSAAKGRASEGAAKPKGKDSKPQGEPDLWEGPAEFVWQKKGGWTLACVSVYNKMLRGKDSWPFERPVDPDALGLEDYYKVIKKPMDMLTIRKKLDEHTYKKVDKEFRADVLLMLDNAMQYNEEGDPIHEHAVNLKALFEEEWKKLLTRVDALPSKPRSSLQPEPEATPKNRSKADSEVHLTGWKEDLRVLLEWLVEREDADAFLEPVDPEALGIPDYFEVIKNPMDLGTVQRKFRTNRYRTALAAVEDIRLTLANAMEYNEAGDPIHEAAKKLSKLLEKKLSTTGLLKGENSGAPAEKGKESARVVQAAATPDSKVALSGWKETLRSVLEWLVEREDAAVFLEPVDPEALGIPDYFEVIKNPMDLGTVQRKFRTNRYRTALAAVEDIRLTLANAMEYNEAGDPIHEAAKKLSKLLEKKVSTTGLLKADKGAGAGNPSKATAAVEQASGGAKPGKGEEARGVQGGWREALSSLLEWLVGRPDAEWFLEPVDAEGLGLDDYFEVVKKPMDLGTIGEKLQGGKYRSAAAVAADVRLVFSNAMQYNNADGDEIHEAAKRLAKQADKKLVALGLPDSSGQEAAGRKRKQADGEEDGDGKSARKSQRKDEGEASTAGAQEYAVGTMVKMLFDDGKWYKGTIDKYIKSKHLYSVAFADGDRQDTRIPADDVQVLASSGKPSKTTPLPETPSTKEPPAQKASTSKKKALAAAEDEKPAAGLSGWKEDLRVLLEWLVEREDADAFLEPVDPEALGIPDYFEVIKNPMDLGTVQRKFRTNRYRTALAAVEDIRLTLANAMEYNEAGNEIHEAAKKLSKLLEKKVSTTGLLKGEDGGSVDAGKGKSRGAAGGTEDQTERKGSKEKSKDATTPARNEPKAQESEDRRSARGSARRGRGPEEKEVEAVDAAPRSGRGRAQTTEEVPEEAEEERPQRPYSSKGSAKSAGRRKKGDDLHEDPEANLGRRVTMQVDGQGVEGFLARYHQRTGKYRVVLDDKKGDVDVSLPSEEVELLPVEVASPAKTGKRTRGSR